MRVLRTGWLSLCAAAAAAGFSAAPATAGFLDYTLDMSTDPVAEGWLLQSGPMPGAHGVTAGVLWLDSPSFRQFRAPFDVWNDEVSNANGWAVEARARLSAEVVRSDERIQMWMMDGVNFNRLEMYSDRIELTSGFLTDTYFMDTTSAFHVYTVEGQGNTTRVLVDGVERLSVNWVTAQGATFVMNFGDGYGPTGSYSYWDYVRITHLPAPGALGLLLPAAMLVRRRR